MKCVALQDADPDRRMPAGNVWRRMTFAESQQRKESDPSYKDSQQKEIVGLLSVPQV